MSTPTTPSTTFRCTCISPTGPRTPPNYLALNHKLDNYISAIASTIEFVRASKRSRKTVTISFDEWNVWYHSNAQDREILGGAKAGRMPRDCSRSLQFRGRAAGRLHPQHVHSPIRRRKIACIAQLVNVIAPIMTEPNGAAWRQTIYYPYYFASRYGRGVALQLPSRPPATTPMSPTTCPTSTFPASTTKRREP